jgi:hypothetical protein
LAPFFYAIFEQRSSVGWVERSDTHHRAAPVDQVRSKERRFPVDDCDTIRSWRKFCDGYRCAQPILPCYHHTPDDTLDKIDPAELAQNVAAYVAFAYLAADADGDFGSALKAPEPKKK